MEHWDEAAATYDDTAGHGRLSPSEHAAWTGLLRRLVDPAQPRRVLDVGTGTGFLALLLAELGHEVVGVDPSEAMLAKARAKADAAALDVEFCAGDAYEPGLTPGSADVVICRHVLWLLDEPGRAVSAWARIATPGGSIVAIDGVWGFSEQRDGTQSGPKPPLREVTDPRPAAEVFRRVGLHEVRAEWLTAIDRVERAAMTPEERRTMRWRRYLVEGRVRG